MKLQILKPLFKVSFVPFEKVIKRMPFPAALISLRCITFSNNKSTWVFMTAFSSRSKYLHYSSLFTSIIDSYVAYTAAAVATGRVSLELRTADSLIRFVKYVASDRVSWKVDSHHQPRPTRPWLNVKASQLTIFGLQIGKSIRAHEGTIHVNLAS